MKTLLTEIPETKNELVQWLEPIIVSADLRHLVSELAVVSTHGKPADLNTLLGGKLDQAMKNGLEEVAEADLQSLFRHPFSLMQLQKEVLENGSNYWLRLIDSSNQIENEADIRQRLADLISDTSPSAVKDKPGRISTSQTIAEPASSRPQLLAMAAGLLLAATIGFFVYANWPSTNQDRVAWGWAAEDSASLADLSESEYLSKLARGAEAWFNRRPSTIETVRKRLSEFKEGCEQLLAATHPQLDVNTKEWLVERLKTCLTNVEKQLAGLDGDAADAIKIRSNVDAIIWSVAGDLKAKSG